MAERLSDDQLADLTVSDKLCPLPSTQLVENGGRNRPKYVWADMSDPGKEPPVVREWLDQETQLRNRLAEQQLARGNQRVKRG